jgi:hypothetical protein
MALLAMVYELLGLFASVGIDQRPFGRRSTATRALEATDGPGSAGDRP